MTKSELIKMFAEKMDITNVKSAEMIEYLFDAETGIIAQTMKKGEEVKLSGFGVFCTHARKARKGVNPKKPSEVIDIPASTTPKFRAGRTLKETLNA